MLTDDRIKEMFQERKVEWATTIGPEFAILFARAIEKEARKDERETLLTDTQNACDHYVKYHKPADGIEPQAFVMWLAADLLRRRELRALVAGRELEDA